MRLKSAARKPGSSVILEETDAGDVCVCVGPWPSWEVIHEWWDALLAATLQSDEWLELEEFARSD